MTYSTPLGGLGVEHLLRHLDGVLHELVHVLTRLLHLLDQLRPDIRQRAPRERLIQIVGGAPQLLGRVVAVELHHPVLHLAVVHHHDGERAILRQRDEFDLRQRDVVRVRQGHQARHVRDARQHLRHGLDQRAAVGRIGAEPALDLLDLLVVQGLELEQGVDEEAVALVGGYASGRGVRRGDEAQIFQVGHDIANGGRGEAQARIARQGPRTDGLPVANIILDQGFEQQLRPLIEPFLGTFCHALHITCLKLPSVKSSPRFSLKSFIA